MADTAPSCKTYLSLGYTTLEIQSKKPSNPSFQPTIQQDTLHWVSGMVCYPIYPQVTITRLSTKCPRCCCCCFTSPPPLPPADWAACLPARSAGPEVVTQQLVPRTAHLAVLPSHTSVPEGAQQGRGKSSLLPATCRPTSCCPLLISCLHGLTSVGGKGRRTRAPPSQVETLPGAHKSGSLPSQHTHAPNTFWVMSIPGIMAIAAITNSRVGNYTLQAYSHKSGEVAELESQIEISRPVLGFELHDGWTICHPRAMRLVADNGTVVNHDPAGDHIERRGVTTT